MSHTEEKIACIRCVGNTNYPADWERKSFCHWCEGTGDDAIRAARENDIITELSEKIGDIRQEALTWWWDVLDQDGRDQYIARKMHPIEAFEEALKDLQWDANFNVP